MLFSEAHSVKRGKPALHEGHHPQVASLFRGREVLSLRSKGGPVDKAFWKRLGLIVAVFAANYGIDRLTKVLAETRLRGSGVHSYLGGLFILVYAENDGAFLSMGSSWPFALKIAVFVALPLAVCLVALFYCLFRPLRTSWTVIIVTIIAGGIGNLQDRIFNSFRVVDFMNFGIGDFRTGILNFSDISVTFGAIALAVVLYLSERREEKEGGGTPPARRPDRKSGRK
jgi:signal peptidase II